MGSVVTGASGALALTSPVIVVTDAEGYGPRRNVYTVPSRIQTSYPTAPMRLDSVSASSCVVKTPKSTWTVSPFDGTMSARNPRPVTVAMRLSAAVRGRGSDRTRYPVCALTCTCANPPADRCFAMSAARSRSKSGPIRTMYSRLGDDACGLEGGAAGAGCAEGGGAVGAGCAEGTGCA